MAIPMLSSCLWIFSEKYAHVTYYIHNNTDKLVSIIAHKSLIIRGADSIRLVTNPSIPKIDADTVIRIEPNCNYMNHQTRRGGGCGFDFSYLIEGFANENSYIDSTLVHYRIDSLEILFGTDRHLIIIGVGNTEAYNDFWRINERGYKECSRHKGDCECVFNCYIADEMYEQATPICR